MSCSSLPRAFLVLLGLAACARENPIFGLDGTGEDSGSSGTSRSTTDGIETTISSQSSTVGTTMSDPDTGSASSGVDGDSTGSTGTPECGNGVKESPEQCDAGENNGEEQLCLPDCTKNVCGDGHLAPDQPCDDQNNMPDDGCDMCKLTTCGNGKVEPPEECDEGPVGSAACTSVCTVPYCGDTIITQPEQCDDGNEAEDDDCIACVSAACGDGHTYDGVEECDDHNTEDNDGCSAICVEEICGDGIVQDNEECDGAGDSPPHCIDDQMQLVELACDSEQCRWFADGGVECCMPAGEPCTNQIPCCPGLNCIEMTGLCGAG